MLSSRTRLLIAALAGGPIIAAGLALLTPGSRPSEKIAEKTPELRELHDRLQLMPVLDAEQAVRANPENAETRLRLAQVRARAQDPAGAALALYPLLKRSPEPEWIAEYVTHCADAGWLVQARAALKQVPNPSAAVRIRLADAYVRYGKPGDAVELLTALDQENLQLDEWLDGARLWFQCRRARQAAQWARRAVLRQPDHTGARAMLARCLLANHQPEASLEALNTAGSLPDPVLEFWRGRAELRCRDAAVRKAGLQRLGRIVQENPENGIAAFDIGSAYLRSGLPERAAPLLARAVQSGYQEVLSYELLARALDKSGRKSEGAWAAGRAHAIRGRLKEARRAFARSLALDPRKGVAYVDLGSSLSLGGELDKALSLLDRAQETHPEDVDLAILKASVLGRLGRAEEREQELKRAAELEPQRANLPLTDLGMGYHGSERYDEGIAVLERAVRVQEEDARAHLYLGLSYSQKREGTGFAVNAVRHLVRAGSLQPDYFYPWTTAGALLQQSGYLAEAAACYRRAIACDPRTEGPYLALSQVLQLQNALPERALVLQLYHETRGLEVKRTRLESQVTDSPTEAPPFYELGTLLLEKGSHQKAFTRLLVAASLKPEWKAARERLADACALLGYDDLREEAEHALR